MGIIKKGKIPLISWKIMSNFMLILMQYICRLCLKEKLLIITFSNLDILLNKSSEIIKGTLMQI